MSDKYLSLSEFELEGQFLGFVGDTPGKFKYLRMALQSGNVEIKIPKELRGTLSLSLVPGNQILVSGIKKLDSHTGEIKLKAYRITPDPQQKIPSEQQTLINDPVRKCPQAKILVCQKSGCSKRGGASFQLKLEKILRDRGLLDQVTIEYTGCQKCCSSAPNCILQLGNKQYKGIHPEAIASMLEDHLT